MIFLIAIGICWKVRKMEKNQWNWLLNKNVVCIVNDPPMDIPKKKEGIVSTVTETHLILNINKKREALLLTGIRRIELRDKYYEEIPEGDF